jgi:hypothetical protein
MAMLATLAIAFWCTRKCVQSQVLPGSAIAISSSASHVSRARLLPACACANERGQRASVVKAG